MPPFCHLQLVTDFTPPPVAAAPDARLHVNFATGLLTYERRPGIVSPFNGDRLFFLACKVRPAAFMYNGRNWHLDPPTDETTCRYWRSRGTGLGCPSAPVCPYRANIVRLRATPIDADSFERVALTPIEYRTGAGDLKAPEWNLFPLHDLREEWLSERPAISRQTGLVSIPPIEVPCDDREGFFGPFATRLRQVLTSTRPQMKWLRSDLLVTAIDLPGVREAAAGGLLDSLDLDESFPPVRFGEESLVTHKLIVRLLREPSSTHPIAFWREVFDSLKSGSPDDVLSCWLRKTIQERLASSLVGTKWVTGGSTVKGYAPIEPGREYYDAEPTGNEIGEPITSFRRLLGEQPDGVNLSAEFARLTSRCSRTDRVELEYLKSRLFGLVLGRVPGYFMRPQGYSPWPGQLFEWWLRRPEEPARGGVVSSADELVPMLTTTTANLPVRVASGRLGFEEPRRFVLGHSKLALAKRRADSEPRGWAYILAGLSNGRTNVPHS